MAMALAEAGADIVALDRRESEQTGQAVMELGRCFKSIVCDLRQATTAELQQIVAQITAEAGRLDIW
jgi:2-deoxy-D-gluconate 3-dehydrogenase